MHTITGLDVEEICADLTTFVGGRDLDDDANVLLHFTNGARGILSVSQIAVGQENNLMIRVWGTEGALEWHQESPNYLKYWPAEGPMQVMSRGNDYLCDGAQQATRLPTGHPEAFIEAFANVYVNATDMMRAKILGQEPSEVAADFPTVYEGARGVFFIEKVVESTNSDKKWTPAQSKW
jgi:predicted dehydrogenase